MKRLTLICGPSGIGKSTLAELLVDKFGGIWREADTYFINDDGQYVFDPTKLPMAHEWCRQEVEDYMMAGCENIVVSNTFTSQWEREPYIELGVKHGYEIVVIRAVPVHNLGPVALSARNSHGVPESVIQKQLSRMV